MAAAVTRLIVDGNGLVCRLWWARGHAVPERFDLAIRLAWEHVSGTLGGGPGTIVVAWDSSKNWRRDVMPEYKAHRGEKPERLLEALRFCRRCPGVVHLGADGFEADDVMATLARKYREQGDNVFILTEDKDLMQLVDDRCFLLNGKLHLIGREQVIERFGVPPERIRHYLSWVGDHADGLPGVPGVGPKRAVPKALAGEIGDQLTYDLTELATVSGLEAALRAENGGSDVVSSDD